MAAIYRSDAGRAAVERHYTQLLGRWPVPYKHFRIRTREGDTFVVASGPPGASPLVLLQGSGANAALWMRSIAALAEHFRVYAVDLIGEPGLSAPSRPPLASNAYTLWMDDVLNGLSIRRGAFMGVSLGGWVALNYAVNRADRVERLVLLCPSGIGRQKSRFPLKALPLLLLGGWGRRRIMRMLAGGKHADVVQPDPETAHLLRLIGRHFRPRRERVPIVDDEMLKRLMMPVQLTVGGRDVMLDSAESRRRLERTARQVTVHYLPKAGHLLPDQTAEVLDFLAGIPASRVTAG